MLGTRLCFICCWSSIKRFRKVASSARLAVALQEVWKETGVTHIRPPSSAFASLDILQERGM